MTRTKSNALRVAILAALALARTATSDITIDGTLPGTTAGALAPVNGTYTIPQSRGFVNATNLFHSFGEFNVYVGQTAAFTGNPEITNIISRVTGGVETTIDGTVRSDIEGAKFWFVNPAGVIVNYNAYFDVSGSLSIGSADFVEFQGGLQWHAIPGSGSEVGALSVDPHAFGFLEGFTAAALRTDGWRLIQDGEDFGADAPVPPPTDPDHPVPDIAGLGDVLLAGGSGVYLVNSAIQTNSQPGASPPPGDITILSYSGDVSLNGTLIGAVTKSSDDSSAPAEIRIEAQKGRVVLDTARIRASTFGRADAANVTIVGRDVLLNGGAFGLNNDTCGSAACYTRINTQTFGAGNAGAIRIMGTNSVASNVDENGAADGKLEDVEITAASDPVGGVSLPGTAGEILISAGTREQSDEGELSGGEMRLNSAVITVSYLGRGKGGTAKATNALHVSNWSPVVSWR